VELAPVSGFPLDEASATAYKVAVFKAIPLLLKIRDLRAPETLQETQKQISQGAGFIADLFRDTAGLLEELSKKNIGVSEKVKLEKKAEDLFQKYAVYDKQMLSFMSGIAEVLAYEVPLPVSDPYRSRVLKLLTRIGKASQPVLSNLQSRKKLTDKELERYVEQVTPLYQELASLPNVPIYLRSSQKKLKEGAQACLEQRKSLLRYTNILLQANFDITERDEKRLHQESKRMKAFSKEAMLFHKGISEIFSY
jgi:hypothetical protein